MLQKLKLSCLGALLVLPSWAFAHTKTPYSSPAAHHQAVEFAPGIISTKEHFEINTVFNKAGDKVIFSRCSNDFKHCTLMQSSYQNGQWQAGKPLPFSGEYLDADPYYNGDYSQLYYISKRPITAGGKATDKVNFWRVGVPKSGTREGEQTGWGAPEYLSNLSSDADDLYPSFTAQGDFYFPSFRNEQRLMYVAKKTATGFAAPQAIPASVYGENARIGDSAVSRDGKSIVFSISNRSDGKGRGDLYVSHWRNGQWTVAKSLGGAVNTPDHEFTPIFSPNGKYLFFTRIENGLGNLYQIHKSQLDW